MQDPTDDREAKTKNPHYYKDVEHLKEVDIYRVLDLFGVTHPCIQHAVKKLLVTGGRAGGKTTEQDVREAIYSLQRWQEMHVEDTHRIDRTARVSFTVAREG